MGFDGNSIQKTSFSSVFEVWDYSESQFSRWDPTQNPSKKYENEKILKKNVFFPYYKLFEVYPDAI